MKKCQAKLSGPILDRITDVLYSPLSRFYSLLRRAAAAARELQRQRFAGENIPHNAAIPGGHVVDYCRFSAEGLGDFKATIDRSDLTTRSMDRLAKVARTIADLGGAERVEAEHVREAAGYVVGGVLGRGDDAISAKNCPQEPTTSLSAVSPESGEWLEYRFVAFAHSYVGVK